MRSTTSPSSEQLTAVPSHKNKFLANNVLPRKAGGKTGISFTQGAHPELGGRERQPITHLILLLTRCCRDSHCTQALLQGLSLYSGKAASHI